MMNWAAGPAYPPAPAAATTGQPFAVLSTTAGFRAGYDSNGNMVVRVECRGEPSCSPITYTQAWDAENRLAVVTDTVTGQVTRFVYDGDGNRILRTDGSGTTVTIGDYYEKQGAVVTKYYYAGGQRIAMRVGGVVYWLHGDHLGSATLTTDLSGNRFSEQRYSPYGVTRYGSSPTERQFTGQRNEVSLGLYDYGARMYSHSLGRFISPDTLVPDFANPQLLNRYAYGLNNPLRYRDPSGHIPLDEILDAVFLGMDVAFLAVDAIDAAVNGLTPQTQQDLRNDVLALAADLACAATPYVTGGGLAVRVGRAGSAALAVAQVETRVSKGVRLIQGGIKIVQFANKGTQTSLPKVYGPNEGPEIALGHRDPEGDYPGLEEFAQNKGAKWYEEWWKSGLLPHDVGGFSDQFENAMLRTRRAHFALDGIGDLSAALRDGAKGWYRGKFTNVELYEILHNKDWYDKTVFYRGSEIVSLPFLGGP